MQDLVSNGWQQSNECRFDTRIILNRIAPGDAIVIPVYYYDFDVACDGDAEQYYRSSWGSIQSANRKRDTNHWMESVLTLIPGEVQIQEN